MNIQKYLSHLLLIYVFHFPLILCENYCEYYSPTNYCGPCTQAEDCGGNGNDNFCQEMSVINGSCICMKFQVCGSPKYQLTDLNKKVTFRIDDIQDYYLKKAQIKVIETFAKKEQKLDIGIIGKNIGKDTDLISLIDKYLRSGNLEIFSHGWDDTVMEGHPKDQQLELLDNANQAIADSKFCNWDKNSTVIYVPHQNQYDINTQTVLAELNFAILSSSWPMKSDCELSGRVKHAPVGASTNDWINMFNGVTHTQTFNEVNKQYLFCGFSVIMMHPQEFSKNDSKDINEDQIKELELLIDKLIENNYSISFMTEAVGVKSTFKRCEESSEENADEDKTNYANDLLRSYNFWYIFLAVVFVLVIIAAIYKVKIKSFYFDFYILVLQISEIETITD